MKFPAQSSHFMIEKGSSYRKDSDVFKSYLHFGGGDVVVVVFFALSKLHFSLSKREMGGRGRRGGEARSHTF